MSGKDPSLVQLTDIIKFFETEEDILNTSLSRTDVLYISKVPLTFYQRKGDGTLEKLEVGDEMPQSITYPFDDAAERDAFFSTQANRDLLYKGITHANLDDDGTGAAALYVWNGEDQPTSYDASNWRVLASSTPLTAAQYKALYESNPDTNAFTDAFLAVLQRMSYSSADDEVIFSVSVQIPGTTLKVGPQVELFDYGGGPAFKTRKDPTEVILPVTITLDTTTGDVTDPFTSVFTRNEDEERVPPSSPREYASGTSFEYSVVASDNAFISKLYGYIGATAPTEDITLSIYEDSVSEDNRLVDDIVIDHTTVGANTKVPLDVTPVLGFIAGRTYVISITSAATFDIEINSTAGFIRYNADRIVATFKTLATQEWVNANDANDYVSGVSVSDDGEITLTMAGGLANRTATIPAEFVQDIIGAAVAGDGGIDVSYDDTTGLTTISLSGSSYNTPRLTNLAIDIPSRVDLNTDLNVNKTLTFDVVHPENIDGNLSLEVTTGDNKNVLAPFVLGENTKSVLLTGISTTSQGTVTFKLTGTDTNGGTIESNTVTVNIRDLVSHEYIYYGIGVIDPATVDVSTLSQQDATSGNEFSVTIGPSSAGDDIVFLAPFDHDLTAIINTALNIDVITSYTKVTNARTINSVQYHSYELSSLNAGFTFNYTVRNA